MKGTAGQNRLLRVPFQGFDSPRLHRFSLANTGDFSRLFPKLVKLFPFPRNQAGRTFPQSVPLCFGPRYNGNMTTHKPGNVYEYTPEREDRWCREGMAIADGNGRLFDTYWTHGGDAHRLTRDELATAELIFNLSDFRELPRHEEYQWREYSPSDRQVVNSQHGLVKRFFVRVGASPDLATKIQNARDAVEEARQDVVTAEANLKWRHEQLTRLITNG